MSTRATLEHGTYREHSRLEEIVVRAVPGGALLLIATILSLIMSNSGL